MPSNIARPRLVTVPDALPSALDRADAHFAEARRDASVAALAIFGDGDVFAADLRKLGEKPDVLTSPAIRHDAERLADHVTREIARMRASLTNAGRIR